VTSPSPSPSRSGLDRAEDRADRSPSEAEAEAEAEAEDDRVRRRLVRVRDPLRDWGWDWGWGWDWLRRARRVDADDAERFLPAATAGEDGASASDLSSPSPSLAVRASSSALALLVRYAGRGGGGWVAGSCRGTSSPDCSPDSSSLVAASLALLEGLPRRLGAAPERGVNTRTKVEDFCSKPLILDMILVRRLSYAR
jgi:hypothetical protein